MKAYLVGLVLSMSVSLGCVIALYMYYPGLKTLVPFFLIMVSGLIGLFFATKVKAKKNKRIVTGNQLSICYPINIPIFFEWLVRFFK
ncbi:hypothetical protein ACOU99_001452 [Enterococcus hirae]